jgi:RNA polymerase sigma factor (sigma-70 family)
LNTAQDNIEDIIEGCRKGNRRDQEKLYKNFYRSLILLCLRYTKNESDAAEALNTGFLKVFKNIGQYKSSYASLYTWIRTIVINSCLDQIKARQRSESWQDLKEATEVHIHAEIVQRMKAEEILQLVRSLPPATRAVFNLYVIEGFSHKEISELLQISTGTSKWHLSEARKILQKMIHQQDVKHP